MPEWLNMLNAWSALPLAVLGFSITIWQVVLAKGKAEAARLAAAEATEQVRANLLLIVAPQLLQVESRLEWAVSKDNRDAVIHYLGEWRWQAGQVRGHLIRAGHRTDDLLTNLQTSIATAAETKLTLQDPASDLNKRARSAQRAIALVTGQVGELTAKTSLEGTKDDNAK